MLLHPLVTGITQNCSTTKSKYIESACCNNADSHVISSFTEDTSAKCGDVKTSYIRSDCCDTKTGPFVMPYPKSGYEFNAFTGLQENWPFGLYKQSAYEFPTHLLTTVADEPDATVEWLTNNWAVDSIGSFTNDIKAEDSKQRSSTRELAWNIVGKHNGIRDLEKYGLNEIMKYMNWGHGAVWTINTVTSGETIIPSRGGDWFDGGILLQLVAHHFPPKHPGMLYALQQLMQKISLADNMIASPHVSEHGKFHAKLKRAHAYFTAADMFGHIHVVEDVSKGPQEQVRVKMTRTQLFESAEATFLEALGKPSGLYSASCTICTLSPNAMLLDSRDEKYDFTVGSVLAALAQMYINAGVITGTARWQDAHNAASLLLQKNMYKLSDATVHQPNYGRRNPAVWNDPLTTSGYDALFTSHNGDNPEIIMHLPQGWSDIPDNEKVEVVDVWTQATIKEWVNANNGGVNIAAMSSHYYYPNAWGTDFAWCGTGCNGYMVDPAFARLHAANDPRQNNFHRGVQYKFDGTPALDPAAAPFPDTGVPKVPSVVNYTLDLNEIWPNAHRFAGYRLAKPRPTNTSGAEMDYKTVVYRLAEAYFIRAEAKARLENDWSNAETLADVNMIRARVGMPAYTSLTEEEFFNEKSREMFLEGRRRQDLIRNGRWSNPTAYKEFESLESSKVFPIPQLFIDLMGWEQHHPDYLDMPSQFPPPGWGSPPPSPPLAPPTTMTAIPVIDDPQWNALTQEQKQTMADQGFDKHVLGKFKWKDGVPQNNWMENAIEPFKTLSEDWKAGDMVDVNGFAYLALGDCQNRNCAWGAIPYDNSNWIFAMTPIPKSEWPEWTALNTADRAFLEGYGYNSEEVGKWAWNSGIIIAGYNVQRGDLPMAIQFKVALPVQIISQIRISIESAQNEATMTGNPYVDPIGDWGSYALKVINNGDTQFLEVDVADLRFILA